MTTLKVLQKLVLSAPLVGEALVPYYRQILPIFNIFKTKNRKSAHLLWYNLKNNFDVISQHWRWHRLLTAEEGEHWWPDRRDSRIVWEAWRGRCLHQHQIHDPRMVNLHHVIVIINIYLLQTYESCLHNWKLLVFLCVTNCHLLQQKSHQQQKQSWLSNYMQ